MRKLLSWVWSILSLKPGWCARFYNEMKNTVAWPRASFPLWKRRNQHHGLSSAGCGFLRVAAGRMRVPLGGLVANAICAIRFIVRLRIILTADSHIVFKSHAQVSDISVKYRNFSQAKVETRFYPPWNCLFWLMQTSSEFLPGNKCTEISMGWISYCLL